LVPRPTIELDAVGGRAALGPLALYELAVAALVLTGLAFLALGRRYRPALALVREDVAAARAAGIPVERLRVGALTASATVGGLAGVLLVHLDGVTDPTRYGPLLSVKLFIVVVLGGVTTAWGPAIGLAAIAVVDRLADAITNAFGGATDRVQPLAAGVTLLVVLVVAGRGIVPEVTARLRRRARRRSGEREHVHPSPPHPFGPVAGTWLEAYDVAVAFGGVQALAGVDLVAEPAACHAVIGPNGSGKTTLLRVLAGVVRADQGVMWLGETEVTTFDAPARRRAGLARSVQRPAAAPGLTAVGHVIAAAEAARADGWFRSLVATPGARAERHRVESEARRALAAVGLTAAADRDVAELNAFARRLLQIAMTLVGGARVILLDEPSAGMRAAEEQHLHAVLTRLRNAGLTIVVVEHNLRLVAGIADEVTVLDAGQIIARGHPDEVVRDPAVVAAYLGDPDDS
jgi:branched-chain amino acid transport system permease protein